MAFLPHIENVTRKSTISHFLLMFGYKLFSLYFPLFLIMKGLSLPQVGFIYLLIYLPIAISSPLVGIISHKINPSILIIAGIIGYAIYSLGMLFVSSSVFFYLLQILLGLSAALFFVTNRQLLMAARLERPAGSFGWFYSAPYYASEFAPAIGALIIFLWGFSGVFIASIAIHIANIILTFFAFRGRLWKNEDRMSIRESFNSYIIFFKKLVDKSVFSILLIAFSVLVVGGFYHSFFVLFLKDIGWSQNIILIYLSVFSIVFLPLSILGIKLLSSSRVANIILKGSVLIGFSTVLFGLYAGTIGLLGIFILMELQEFGSFITNSARSGFLSKLFSSSPKEAGAIDTIFSSLGIALGSLTGGLLVGYLGYSMVFIIGGIIVLFLSLITAANIKNFIPKK